MNARAAMGCAMVALTVTAMSSRGSNDEIPNGKDAYISGNAVNVPVGRVVLVRRNGEHCALYLTSASYTRQRRSARYRAYYVPNTSVRFTSAQATTREDEVYQEEPRAIIGRCASARFQTALFCGRMTLEWSGARNGSGWVYLDEKRTLEIAPTRWRDVQQVDLSDKSLRWFRYGDVDDAKGDKRLELE